MKIIKRSGFSFFLLQAIGWAPVLLVMTVMFGDTPLISKYSVTFGLSVTTLGVLMSFLLRLLYQWIMLKTKSVFLWVVCLFLLSFAGAFSATQLHMLAWQGIDRLIGGVSVLYTSQPSVSITLVLFVILLMWSCLYWAISRQSTMYMLEQQNQVMALKTKEAQFNALLDQLSPHFMFNAINNIRAMVLIDNNKARDMLMAFADLMRYQLTDQNAGIVTLEQELEFVEDFVALHQLQLGRRLTFKKDIDPRYLTQSMPKMALQLLVENAIKHAFGKQAVSGELHLSVAALNSKQWHISLTHPGKILSQDEQSTGLGIENLKARLAMFSAQQITFTLQTADDKVQAKLCFGTKE
ncbi:sensor histidine kinase [Pseudoalteromonas sp. MTN2-4]|uniref:sensor histidine kinase n=1 Tax=Pseudoalteromonas sp. MTN2-4 TaxID=3056555 RepID=UPI0036F1D862